VNLPLSLLAAAERQPDAEALPGITYAELRERAARIAGGLVSRERARIDYGVIFDGDGEEITVAESATSAERAEQRQSRRPLDMFDRGDYFRSLSATEESAAESPSVEESA
jgi:non-ribosomal peptide synthetase component F